MTEKWSAPRLWAGKRYRSLDYDLKSQFGEKVYRIALNAGLTCPNRDGKVGTGGCIFCSEMGSGDFAGVSSLSIREQLLAGKEAIRSKRGVQAFIAYFQAFTNTYAPLPYLEKIFTEAAEDPEVKVLSVATRPDCLEQETVELLSRLNKKKPVWVELGLQTIHEETAEFIRRGYELPVFYDAVQRLRREGISVIVHVILYLPGETEEMMLSTIRALNRTDIQGIKLQLLHILRGTDLYRLYEKQLQDGNTGGIPRLYVPSMEEYTATLGKCICGLRPDISIHRLTGDGPKDLLIAPQWTAAKRTVLNYINQYLKENNLWQGKDYYV